MPFHLSSSLVRLSAIVCLAAVVTVFVDSSLTYAICRQPDERANLPSPSGSRPLGLAELTCALPLGLHGPAVFEPSAANPSQTLHQFVSTEAKLVRAAIRAHGAVLLRGFMESTTPSSLADASEALGVSLDTRFHLDPIARSRGEGSGGRAYVASLRLMQERGLRQDGVVTRFGFIPPHTEMGHYRVRPSFVGFLCAQPAPEGGETAIIDMQRVRRRTPLSHLMGPHPHARLSISMMGSRGQPRIAIEATRRVASDPYNRGTPSERLFEGIL